MCFTEAIKWCVVTHHTSCLHSLRHIPSIGLTPEDMTVKTMTAGIHDKGKRVHVTANAHEGQETNAALHQHFLFILATHTIGCKIVKNVLNMYVHVKANLMQLICLNKRHHKNAYNQLTFLCKVF